MKLSGSQQDARAEIARLRLSLSSCLVRDGAGESAPPHG
jgi:hypothetical protein